MALGLPEKNETRLDDLPTDTISAVQFCPSQHNGRLLMVSSWDGSIRVYDSESNKKRHIFEIGEPVLDCCFSVSADVSGGTVMWYLKQGNWCASSTMLKTISRSHQQFKTAHKVSVHVLWGGFASAMNWLVNWFSSQNGKRTSYGHGDPKQHLDLFSSFLQMATATLKWLSLL